MPRRRTRPLETQRAAIGILHDRLVDTYGRPEPERSLPPLDELILTILSQNTTDTNRDRAWERLRQRLPTWADVAEAARSDVEEAIAPGGLQRVKAERIQTILAEIHERHGDYTLEHLREADLDQAREELAGVKGLGAKSVNCILLFSLGLPAFPVDTHVYRVLRRIGVHDAKTLTRANDELQDAVAAEIAYPFHMNVIRHGRETCHARRPECWRCAVEDLCGYPDKPRAE